MNLTGGIVLFAVIWFLVFFVVLQATPGSQADAGEVVPGTPASAPSDARILWKAKITTIITILIWAAIAAVIFSGLIDIYDLDFFGRLGPRPAN
ncbi:MAG: DUF1467 family protein [Paracoccaceae bacterium]